MWIKFSKCFRKQRNRFHRHQLPLTPLSRASTHSLPSCNLSEINFTASKLNDQVPTTTAILAVQGESTGNETLPLSKQNAYVSQESNSRFFFFFLRDLQHSQGHFFRKVSNTIANSCWIRHNNVFCCIPPLHLHSSSRKDSLSQFLFSYPRARA